MIPGGAQTAIACNQFESGDTWVFALYYDGGRYSIPADAEVSITGTKPDGAAYNIEGSVVDNAVVITVTDQITACAGRSIAEILVESEAGGTTLYSANFPLLVEPAAVQGEFSPSEIPAAIVDADGNVYLSTEYGAGLSDGVKQALLNVVAHIGAWNVDDPTGQDYYDALEEALYPPANLTSISAAYTQSGDVYDNQTLDSLRSNLVVTAMYDNGTSAPVTTYTLSGTLTTGTSTITVAYGGKTATFTVVVTHAVTQYSITNNLTNCTNSNSATAINEETAYSGTLTATSGNVMSTVAITMGGTDITSTAYDSATGGISIASVTGNVVITAEAVEDVGWVSGVPYTLENWTDGYSINNSTGELTESSSYSATDFLPCSGVDCFINADLYQNYRMYFYDAEKNFLGLSIVSGVRSASEVTPKFRAAYVRSYANTNKKASATITPYDYPTLSESTVLVTGQRYTPNYVQYKTINTNTGVVGDSTSAASYATEDYGLILGATKGYYSDKESKYWVCFYDAGKNYISDVRGGASITEFDIPEGAYYARFLSEVNKGFYWFE